MQITFITFDQLLKAQKRFNIGNRKIVIKHNGIELPITQYIEDYWTKCEKHADKPEYINYLHQHNELKTYLNATIQKH